MGKTLGSDLQKQKLTLPVIYLLSQAAPAQRGLVRELLARPDQTTRDELQPLLESSGAIDYARSRAVAYTVAARQKLGCLPESPARQILEEMAEFVAIRSA